MTRAKSKSKGVLLKRWLLWVNLFFIFILLLTYLTPYISVEKWGWLSLLALAYPFTLLLNGLFALGWFFFRSWYALFSTIAIIAGMGTHIRYVKIFSTRNTQAQCDESIRLMSYNVRGLSMVKVKKGEGIAAKIDSFYNALNDLNAFPDILCLQEAGRGDLISKKLGLKYNISAPKTSLMLLSRYPIEKHGELDGLESVPSCIWADIRTPQGMVRIYNIHLVSNRITGTTEELIQDMSLQHENTWNNIRFIVSRYKQTTKKRAKEAENLRQHLSQSPHPAIIAGDGNDTPLSHTYHLLSEDLKDSFKEQGSGLSTTYASKLPLLRIDYLLGTSNIEFKDHHTHHLGYSDHFPVSTGFCIQTLPGS